MFTIGKTFYKQNNAETWVAGCCRAFMHTRATTFFRCVLPLQTKSLVVRRGVYVFYVSVCGRICNDHDLNWHFHFSYPPIEKRFQRIENKHRTKTSISQTLSNLFHTLQWLHFILFKMVRHSLLLLINLCGILNGAHNIKIKKLSKYSVNCKRLHF